MARARVAITLFFFADGLLIGSWASRIPAVQGQTDLTSPELGLALFGMSLGAVVAMPLAGWVGVRVGSRPTAIVALVGMSVALVLASLAAGLGALASALLIFGASFGALNVAANAQGLALERRYGRSILSSFHAAFSGGGLAGAGIGGLIASAGIGPRTHFGAIGAALAPTALLAGRRLLVTKADGGAQGPILVRPRRALLLLGLAAFFTLLAEGAVADWSAVYLSRSLGVTAAVAALAYTGFSFAMATSRTVGDRLNDALGPAALARDGALLAAGGIALALVSGSSPAALVGFAAMGAGLGVVVPVLFRAAGSRSGVPAGVGIAAVSTLGWFGFLVGPAAIGSAAGIVGLRAALGIVVVATAMVALLSSSAAPRSEISEGSTSSRTPCCPTSTES